MASPPGALMVVKRILDNGVTVLVDEMRDVRSFSLGFFVAAGSADETDSRRGLSHFLEHLLFKRTRHRSNAEIAREIDRLGGDVDAFTTREYTGFYAHTLDGHFEEALDLVSDIVLAPAFASADVETERGVILEEIGEANDNPEDLVHEMFVRSFWKGHPLGAPILGTEETVRSIAREDLYAYYRSRYTPRNLIVSVAGHVRGDRVLASIGRLFRRRAGRAAGGAAARLEVRRPKSHQHVQVRSRGGLEQAHLCLGVAGPGQLSGRRFAASLVDVVLGGGMSSRLFQEVREKRGLAYSIGSSLNAYRPGGYETISAACAPKNLTRVLEVTLRELRRLKRDGVRTRELRWAKENVKGNMILSLESTVARMSSAARQEFYLGRVLPLEDWIAKIEAVSEDDVGEEAERLLDGRVLSLSVVGNVAELPFSAPELARALSA
jgi:predicted Zn-dependent peptidase